MYPHRTFLKLVAVLFCFQAAADTQIPVTLENHNYRPIGAGFDSRRSEFRGDCVEVTNVLKPERHLPKGAFALKLVANQQAIADKLGLSAGGRYRAGVVSGSASAEFLNEAKSNAFSITYNYVLEDMYQEYAENSTRQPIKPRPGIEPYMRDARTFFSNCGDEYVYARVLAARLFVTMRIDFISKHERNRFAAEFEVNAPNFGANGKLEKIAERFNSNNQISVRVEQQGGDPAKKGRALCPRFADGKVDEECAKSSRNVVNCTFGNLGPCLEVIANLIAYANAQDGDNFPSQVANGANYWVSSLVTRPFTYIGADYPMAPQKSKEDTFQAEVAQLSGIFEEEYASWNYAHQLAFGQLPRLSDRQREAMNLLEARFLKNMARISTGIENCFTYGYSKCTGEVQDVLKFVGYQDPRRPGMKEIEALTAPEVFIQWCDLANSENPELQATITALKNHLVAIQALATTEIGKGDLCVKLNDRLQGLRALDLSDATLSVLDLRPIGSLTGLEELKLPNKRITSIAALKNLKKLRVLDLSGNFIKDLSPLGECENLQNLNVANNQLASLDALKGLPALTDLDARGNSPGLQCPLRDPSGCRLLDFSRSTTISLKDQKCAMRVGAAAVNIGGGRVLVSGGLAADGQALYRAGLEVQTRDKCLQLETKMALGRAHHTATLLKDGRVLIAGGFTDKLEIFDPATGTSQLLPVALRSRRADHSASLLLDGRVVFVGGYASVVETADPSTRAIASVEVFDPQTGRIEDWGSLSIPRAGHSTTLLQDGRLLVVGGFGPKKMINAVEVITPSLKTIEILDTALNTGRAGHAAALLSDGSVLIAGGYTWKNGETGDTIDGLATLEIFDPNTTNFIAIKDQLTVGRGGLGAATLPDGRVLLAGGDTQATIFDPLSLKLASAQAIVEVYDPSSRGVYLLGHLTYPRHHFAMAPLGARSWLIVGGMGAPESLQSTELLVYR